MPGVIINQLTNISGFFFLLCRFVFTEDLVVDRIFLHINIQNCISINSEGLFINLAERVVLVFFFFILSFLQKSTGVILEILKIPWGFPNSHIQ